MKRKDKNNPTKIRWFSRFKKGRAEWVKQTISAVNRLMCTSEDTFSVKTAKRWVGPGLSSTTLLIQTWIINLTHSSVFRPAVDSLHYGGCVYITEWIECQKLPACERLDGGKRGGRREEESRRAGEQESREGLQKKEELPQDGESSQRGATKFNRAYR